MTKVFAAFPNAIVAYGVPALVAVALHGGIAAGVWVASERQAQAPKLLNSFEVVELPSSAAVVEPQQTKPEPELEPEVQPVEPPQVLAPPTPEPALKPAPIAPRKPLLNPKPIVKPTPKPVVQPKAKPALVREVAAPAPAPAYVAPSQHADYLDNPKPSYPTVARKRGMEGRVVLRVQVRRDGTVRAVEVSQSTGYALLDRAARAAVVRWRFAPATRGGKAVEGEVLVPFEFRLTAG